MAQSDRKAKVYGMVTALLEAVEKVSIFAGGSLAEVPQAILKGYNELRTEVAKLIPQDLADLMPPHLNSPDRRGAGYDRSDVTYLIVGVHLKQMLVLLEDQNVGPVL